MSALREVSEKARLFLSPDLPAFVLASRSNSAYGVSGVRSSWLCSRGSRCKPSRAFHPLGLFRVPGLARASLPGVASGHGVNGGFVPRLSCAADESLIYKWALAAIAFLQIIAIESPRELGF